MTARNSVFHSALLLGALSLASGCTLESSLDGSEYSAAVPKSESVRIAAPDDAKGDAPEAAALNPAPAKWYDYTRRATEDLNEATRSVVGTVNFVAHTIPSEVGDDYALWGPFTLFDEPGSWKLRIDRDATGEYKYVFFGRPREATTDDAFKVVLEGKGYGLGDERHGDGEFAVHIDVARAINAERFDEGSGTAVFKHDLPPNIDDDPNATPRTLSAQIDPDGDSWGQFTSRALTDGTAELEVKGLVDTDPGATALEDASIVSKWRADGAGRADVTVSGGDTVGGALLDITECWAGDASRVYYADSLGIEPVFGAASNCAM